MGGIGLNTNGLNATLRVLIWRHTRAVHRLLRKRHFATRLARGCGSRAFVTGKCTPLDLIRRKKDCAQKKNDKEKLVIHINPHLLQNQRADHLDRQVDIGCCSSLTPFENPQQTWWGVVRRYTLQLKQA